jgi:expansin (peptidoglycan-binding protein)
LLTGLTLAVVLVACGGADPAEGDGSSGGSNTPSVPLSSELTSGIATFYDYSGSKEVACSFDVGADTNITAMNDAEYAKSASCGSCLAVSGPKGSVTVRIVDRCPGCEKNHIDLSAEAFAKIAEPKAGRVPITYQLVSCSVPGNMSYRIKEGSSKFWTALQVRDHKVPIAKVEYKKKGVYTDMGRVDYNYFIDQKGVGDQPSGIAIRITATDGQVVEDTIPSIDAGKVFPGAVQFK